jgi:hypothetical protein
VAAGWLHAATHSGGGVGATSRPHPAIRRIHKDRTAFRADIAFATGARTTQIAPLAVVDRLGSKWGFVADGPSHNLGTEAVMRAGDTIENPLSGEKIRFDVTDAESAGRYLSGRILLAPLGGGPPEHVHPEQVGRGLPGADVRRLTRHGASRRA